MTLTIFNTINAALSLRQHCHGRRRHAHTTPPHYADNIGFATMQSRELDAFTPSLRLVTGYVIMYLRLS